MIYIIISTLVLLAIFGITDLIALTISNRKLDRELEELQRNSNSLRPFTFK
jgi:hypothetical protein